ncbi:MAG: peptidoglycan -binding protein [Parvularculaceae bacterium]
MARRRSRSDANIWPGFVDGLSTLLLVLMFVLSIFVVAQFYLGERLTSVKDELAEKDSELARLIAQVDSLNEQLGLAQQEKENLEIRVLALEDTIAAKDEELASLGAALAASEAAVAASAEELEAEKALTEDQKSQIATLNAQIAALRRQLASLQEALEAAEAKDLEQQAQIENLSKRLNAALARKVQELQEVRSRFFEALRAALGDRADVRVVGDRFVFESDILFGPCSATISDAGKAELDKLARVLLDIAGDIPDEVAWVMRVDGHADAQPLGPSCRAVFATNRRLSSERAISVVEYLERRAVPARRLVAAGFGSNYPLVGGYSAAALAQNRRIEFKLTER